MNSNQTWKQLGKQLKAKLNSNRGYAILDKYIGGTWTAGGCFYLATALSRILPGERVSLWGKLREGNWYSKKVAQHAVFEVSPGIYLDGDGCSTEKELIKRWEKEEGLTDITLLPYNDDDFDSTSLQSIEPLKAFLKPVFEKFEIMEKVSF